LFGSDHGLVVEPENMALVVHPIELVLPTTNGISTINSKTSL